MKEIEIRFANIKKKMAISNSEYDEINKILAKNNMHLCQNAIFENDYPFRYVGLSKDYQLYIKK